MKGNVRSDIFLTMTETPHPETAPSLATGRAGTRGVLFAMCLSLVLVVAASLVAVCGVVLAASLGALLRAPKTPSTAE